MPKRHPHVTVALVVVGLLVAWMNAGLAFERPQGVRTVDLVDLSDANSEAAHHVSGTTAALRGSWNGRSWRATRDWFSYEMRVFDDSPVTIVCTFVPGSGLADLELIVEGRTLPRTPEVRSERKSAAATRSPGRFPTRGRAAGMPLL